MKWLSSRQSGHRREIAPTPWEVCESGASRATPPRQSPGCIAGRTVVAPRSSSPNRRSPSFGFSSTRSGRRRRHLRRRARFSSSARTRSASSNDTGGANGSSELSCGFRERPSDTVPPPFSSPCAVSEARGVFGVKNNTFMSKTSRASSKKTRLVRARARVRSMRARGRITTGRPG